MRRGRHRHLVKRERNGQPQRTRKIDRGTSGVRSLRAWWAGDGDPALSAYPLGILLVNSQIDDRQHAAVCQFAWLHWAVFGRPSVSAVTFELRSRSSGEGPDRNVETARLRQICDKIAAQIGIGEMTRRGWHGLVDLAVYERKPRWLLPVMPRSSDVADAAAFHRAVSVLTRVLIGAS